jgi:AcrR family transcriptional regulator
VLDAAIALAVARGVEALSIREVARRAGVTHQAPYHYFKDRAAILAAIAEESFVMLGDVLIAARDSAADRPEDQIEACGRAYFDFAVEQPARFRIMFRPESHDPRTSGVTAASQRALQVLLRVILDAQAAGVAPLGDPMALSLTAWSTAHGLSALWVDRVLERSIGVMDARALGTMVARTLSQLLKAGTSHSTV